MNYRQQTSGFRFGPGVLTPFIKTILIANVAVFLLQSVLRGQLDPLLGLNPRLFFSEFPNYSYQVFTYMFLHGGFFHLAFNMLALWMFGTEIEQGWGAKRFATFYLIAGISGGVLPLFVQGIFSQGLIIGASGAVYGVLVAYWLSFPNRTVFFFPIPFPLKVKWAIPGFMLIGFFFGGAGIAHTAHLGGALFGLIYMKLDWRSKSLGNKFRDLRFKRQTAKLDKRRKQAETAMKKVDAILDRINEVGIENLTKEERKFLEDASSNMQNEKDHNQR